ncbi:MAG: DegQ family serine endoprotease [Leptothrix sp. (in: b-proteobacteria)]
MHQATAPAHGFTARRWLWAGVALVAAGAVGLPLMVTRPATAQAGAPALTVAAAPTAGTTSPANAPLVRGLPDFSVLVDQVGPAVVNIRTLTKTHPGRGLPEMDPDMQEFFRRFFGVPVPPRQPDQRRGQPQPQPEEAMPSGVGSGFIISADGYVMTNAHVVDGADEVQVRLTDKREFKARLIGADKRTDIAVLKIEATGLPSVRFGDVARLKVGEWVIAIGSPFNLDNTVTAGIVSAKARDTGEILPFIQTDVAINPGNSGGPLINMAGEVVGVNSQIYSRSGGYMGISFSIPIDEAQRVAEQLRATGRVVRGRIGVVIGDVGKDVAESLGLATPAGALVRSVESGGPADKAGFEAGDIVLKFDGKTVEKSSDLPRLVGNTKPGSKVTVQVLRRGSNRDLSVTVGEMQAEKTAQAEPAETPPPKATATVSLGLQVSELGEAQRRELKLRGGVRIDGVEGAAAQAGLREGDIVLSIANTEITGLRQFEAVVSKLDKSRPINLLIRRGELAQYTVIRPAG